MGEPSKDFHQLLPDFDLFQKMCGSSESESETSNGIVDNEEDVEDISDILDISDESMSDDDEDHASIEENFEEPPAKVARKYIWHKNRDLEDPAEIRTEKDFAQVFRMTRDTFNKLLSMVEFKFPRLGLSNHGHSLTPRQRLLMFLHMAGSDTPGIYRRHNYQLAAGTINENMKVCIEVLYKGKYSPPSMMIIEIFSSDFCQGLPGFSPWNLKSISGISEIHGPI